MYVLWSCSYDPVSGQMQPYAAPPQATAPAPQPQVNQYSESPALAHTSSKMTTPHALASAQRQQPPIISSRRISHALSIHLI